MARKNATANGGKKMTSLDLENLRLLRDEIMQAVAPIAERHGISIKLGKGSYGILNASQVLEFAIIGSDGYAQTPEAKDFTTYAKMFGLDPAWLNKPLTVPGRSETLTIVGLKPNRPKYPVLYKASDAPGKLFKGSELVFNGAKLA